MHVHIYLYIYAYICVHVYIFFLKLPLCQILARSVNLFCHKTTITARSREDDT